jgi:UDP-2,3-diacylglucosamine hydrolase
VSSTNDWLAGYFLSDLHLLSSRSDFHRYRNELQSILKRAHTLVLGGDIFDFRWSLHRSLDRSVMESIRWLEELISSNPHCAFHYLLGNHDCHPAFVSELDRLSFRLPQLEWQPYRLRLGRCVFLHGDILDGGADHKALDVRRLKHGDRDSPPPYRFWLYDAVVKARLHRLAATLVNPRDWVLEKLSQYISEQGLGVEHGTTDVYFGHTHRRVDGVVYRGVKYHNGGAAIQGLGFRIIETSLEKTPP